MATSLKNFGILLRKTFQEFSNDNCARMAAALSYYAVFALPAVILIVVSVAGKFVDPDDIQGRIRTEISSAIGKKGADQVQTMIEHAHRKDDRPGRTLFGIAIVLIGATGVMGQVQAALNEAWGVKASSGMRQFFLKRLISLALIIAVAFILIVSLMADTLFVAFGSQIAEHVIPNSSRTAAVAGNLLGTYLLFGLVFAAMYKYLPDANIPWTHVWLGAGITAALFVVGKWLLSFYLAHSDLGSGFGAAGSLALILVWVYYSGLIFLFGAEFTQVWSDRRQILSEWNQARSSSSPSSTDAALPKNLGVAQKR